MALHENCLLTHQWITPFTVCLWPSYIIRHDCWVRSGLPVLQKHNLIWNPSSPSGQLSNVSIVLWGISDCHNPTSFFRFISGLSASDVHYQGYWFCLRVCVGGMWSRHWPSSNQQSVWDIQQESRWGGCSCWCIV